MPVVNWSETVLWIGRLWLLGCPVVMWTVGRKHMLKIDPLLRRWWLSGSVLMFCCGLFLVATHGITRR